MTVSIREMELERESTVLKRRLDNKWLRIAHMMGFIKSKDYNITKKIKDGVSVKELGEILVPEEYEEFKKHLPRLIKLGLLKECRELTR